MKCDSIAMHVTAILAKVVFFWKWTHEIETNVNIGKCFNCWLGISWCAEFDVFISKSDNGLVFQAMKILFEWNHCTIIYLTTFFHEFDAICWTNDSILPENNMWYLNSMSGGCVGCVDKSGCEGDFGHSWTCHHK